MSPEPSAEAAAEVLNRMFPDPQWVAEQTSKNADAERLMGRRGPGIPIDSPYELGFWCPVCKVSARVGEEYDERLDWSEYNSFLWCRVCDKDYPSALCVPLEGEKDPDRPWVWAGPDDAVKVFLSSVADTKCGATTERAPGEEGGPHVCDRPVDHGGWHAGPECGWASEVPS